MDGWVGMECRNVIRSVAGLGWSAQTSYVRWVGWDGVPKGHKFSGWVGMECRNVIRWVSGLDCQQRKDQVNISHFLIFLRLLVISLIMLKFLIRCCRNSCLLFMWTFKGAKSSIDERAASAMLADQMDKKMGGIATQVS